MDTHNWLYTHSGDEIYKVKIHISNSSLCWSFRKNGILSSTKLESNKILAAKFEECNSPTVHVHYVRVVINNGYVTLKREVIAFYGEEENCREFAESVQQLLEKQESQRPKRLLVFVNPSSGNNTNVSDYKRYVSPLFNLCGVTAHVIETKYVAEPKEVLADYDLSTIDVVVSMGGDGSLNHVASGLIERTMRDAGATIEHADDQLIKPSVTFATLPGGSGNAVAQFLYGTVNMEGCTIAIILGKTTASDILTVHGSHKWITSAYLMVHFGTFSHGALRMNNFRWLGRFRFFFMMWFLWWYWEENYVQIDYLPYEDDVDKSCIKTSTGIIPVCDGPKAGWKTIKLKIAEVWILGWKYKDCMSYFIDPKYRKPDVSDNKMAIRIVRWGTYNQVKKAIPNFDKSLITEIPVRECRIRTDKTGSLGPVICCDGEKILLEHGVDYRVRLHSDRLDVIKIDDELISHASLYENDS